jgi:hypothetical protein
MAASSLAMRQMLFVILHIGRHIPPSTRHVLRLIRSCLLRLTFVVSSSHSSTYFSVRLRRLLVTASVRL